MMRTFSRMSTASSAVTVLAVAVVCFFGNWKSQADAADSPAPSAEEPQIVLKATIIDIDSESMAKLGIALSDLMPDNSRAMPVTEKTNTSIQVASLTVGEGELLVKLLRGIGVAKILAEPTVVSTIGRKATFHSGGHFPVPVPQANGGTIVETRKFGTFLDFTATKQSSGQLRIEIRVGHSERDDSRTVTLNGVNVPGLREKWFDTAFTSRLGQTVMFVGGYQGLVVMVTPEVVDPQVSTPQGVVHLPHSMPATANREPIIVDEKPQRRDVRPSAKRTLNDEIRELRNDVKVLRRDVGRLIDILEERDSTSRKTATPDDDHSSNKPEDVNFKELWDVTLDEVISIGLQNSKAIREDAFQSQPCGRIGIGGDNHAVQAWQDHVGPCSRRATTTSSEQDRPHISARATYDRHQRCPFL